MNEKTTSCFDPVSVFKKKQFGGVALAVCHLTEKNIQSMKEWYQMTIDSDTVIDGFESPHTSPIGIVFVTRKGSGSERLHIWPTYGYQGYNPATNKVHLGVNEIFAVDGVKVGVLYNEWAGEHGFTATLIDERICAKKGCELKLMEPAYVSLANAAQGFIGSHPIFEFDAGDYGCYLAYQNPGSRSGMTFDYVPAGKWNVFHRPSGRGGPISIVSPV